MNSIQGKRKWEPYVWLLPSILLIVIFVVFPILIVFKLSFSEITPGGVIGGFIGFKNFSDAVKLPAFSPQPEVLRPEDRALHSGFPLGDLSGHPGLRVELYH